MIDLPIKKICEKYINGMTLKEIAKEYMCGISTIRKRLIDNDIKIRSYSQARLKQYTEENSPCYIKLSIEEISEKYKNGMSATKLALEYECSIGTIINRLRNNDVKIRTISETNKVKKYTNYIKLPIEEICKKYKNGISTIDLAKEYNTSHHTIIKRLNDNGIVIRSGKELSRQISCGLQHISYEEWEGFASEKPYCPLYNEACKESNREKYGRKCFICGLPEEENITKTGRLWKLNVHHVDMNKQQGCNGIKWKLVPICLHCHNSVHNKTWIARITWLLTNVWN